MATEQATVAPSARHPYAGFVSRTANDEAELATMEAEAREENAIVTEPNSPEDEPLTAEEKTFKKRYGDLRTYSQHKNAEYERQIIELRKQLLDVKAPKNFELPATEEELSGFLTEYPQLAGLIETMINKKVSEVAVSSDERFKQLEAEKAMAAREKALMQLLHAHPDLEEIRVSEDFEEWVKRQPKNIRWALLENTDDAPAASAALDLYKLHLSKRTNTKTNVDASAAAAVRPRQVSTQPNAEGNKPRTFKESELQRMQAKEYALLEEQIDEAYRTGRIEYDISGGAR